MWAQMRAGADAGADGRCDAQAYVHTPLTAKGRKLRAVKVGLARRGRGLVGVVQAADAVVLGGSAGDERNHEQRKGSEAGHGVELVCGWCGGSGSWCVTLVAVALGAVAVDRPVGKVARDAAPRSTCSRAVGSILHLPRLYPFSEMAGEGQRPLQVPLMGLPPPAAQSSAAAAPPVVVVASQRRRSRLECPEGDRYGRDGEISAAEAG